MRYLLGIDLGTSSVRSMLLSEDGRCCAVRGASYDVSIPRLGWAEQDPELWWQKTQATVEEVLRDSGVELGSVKAVSFSGQMHGLVCVGRDGKPLYPAIIWPDQRSADAIEEIYHKLGREYVSQTTQNTISTGFLLASLYWLSRNNRQVYRNIHKVMLPKDYLKYRLTGRFVTDYSDAAGSLAFDNVHLHWATELIERLRLDPRMFPECLPSTEVVGVVTGDGGALGLPRGVLVVNGGSDQCMQSIGNGILTDGIFSANIGTGGQIATSSSAPVYDPGLRTNTFAHVLPGRWNVMGACLSSGASLKWLCEEVIRTSDYRLLDEEAQKLPPGSEGLIFLPYLSGERTPHLDPKARGMFFGLTGKHNQYHLARAVMEGVVFSLKDCIQIITGDLGIVCTKVIASGGGANSTLWMQMQADILERDIHRSSMSEQACLGAAITAGVGSGVFADFEQACEMLIRPDNTVYHPDERNVALYREYYFVYRELYQSNRQWFAKLAQISGS